MNFPQALSLAALIATGLILWTLRQWLLLLFAAVVVGLALCSLVGALQRRFPMRRPLALMVCVSALEAVYSWKSEQDFERFMRFAQRYADANGLGYSQSQDSNQTEGADDQQA